MAITLQLSVENKTLAPLATRSYDKKYTNVPNKAIKGEFAYNLNAVYHACTGQNLDADDHTVTVRSQNSTLSGLYGPTLYGKDDKTLVLRWGQKMLDLRIDPDTKSLAFVNEVGQIVGEGPDNVTASFADIKIGNSRDLVLRLSVFDSQTEETTVLDLSTWGAMGVDDGMPTADELNQFARRGTKKLFNMFKECPSFESFEGETFNLTELAPGQYEVIGYRRLKMDRVQFMMRVKANPALGQASEFELWGHNTVNPSLLTNPDISPENPATLMLHEVKTKANGKKRPIAGLIVESGIEDSDLDLDF